MFQTDLVRVLWRFCRPLFCGARAFRWRWRRPLHRAKIRGGCVAGVYAANTLGAIAGALGFSIVFNSVDRHRRRERALILLAAAGALFMLAPAIRAKPLRGNRAGGNRHRDKRVLSGPRRSTAAADADRLWTAHHDFRQPRENPLLGRRHQLIDRDLAMGRRAVQFHVSGKVEASTESYDMRLQRMLGHLPALLHPNPHRCWWSVRRGRHRGNVVRGAFRRCGRIVVCEMEPLVPPTAARYFGRTRISTSSTIRAHASSMTTPRHFRPHHAGEVRHHYLRSHPSLGEGQRHAVFARVFRAGEATPDPGGIVTQCGAAV